ncbi:uncharacterized protein LOC133296242 [Gastrolobium bilobum]|uniref:uncharacterized protein LOC133296242 n=1 Tax=Gastrolobium bilobum TaxID=150636 RepID=UPI002AB249FA|nr:uncharacterized protein LOC133296242 [Gastrolobium bilobum]
MASRSAPSNSKSHSHTNPPPPHPPASRTCLCSPTTHPGSFRCSMHKKPHKALPRSMPTYPSNNTHHWELPMAAKANSLKAILLQVIKPSSHDLHRRKNFQPKPSRFCLMNGNRDAVAVS